MNLGDEVSYESTIQILDLIHGWMNNLSRNEILEWRDDGVVTLLVLEIHCYSTQGQGHFCLEQQETSADNMAH